MGKVKKARAENKSQAIKTENAGLLTTDGSIIPKLKSTKNKDGSTKTKKKSAKGSDSGGVTQFDPKLNLASLFSSNSISSGKEFKTVVRDKPAFPPIKKTIDKNSAKKSNTLKNKDAAQIRIDAKTKFHTTKAESEWVPMQDSKFKKSKKKRTISTKKVAENGDEQSEQGDSDIDTKLGPVEESAPNTEEMATKQEADTKPQKTFQELNQPKPKNEELEHRTVFVGNVPKELVKDGKHQTLKKLFKPFGKIETIRYRSVTSAKPTVLKKVAAYRNEIHPNRSNVSAYIRFSTREEAELAAKEINGTKLQDHHLTVDLADNSGSKRDNKKAIFIGNLQLNTEDEDLWKFFEDCGAIESVRIIRDQASGLGKGFGYVNFQDTASIELALTKNEEVLNGRPLRISRVVKKPKKKNLPEGVSRDTNRTKTKGKGKERVAVKSDAGYQGTFTGDRMSEIGKLKRNAKKVNKGDLKKARIAKQLMGTTSRSKPFTGEKSSKHFKNKFNRNGAKEKVKKSKSSSARKGHSRERSAKFKKQNLASDNKKVKTGKEKTPFKRYFSK